MEIKRNLLKSTFADVYGSGYTPSNYTGPEYTQTITPNANYVYVHDSVFRSCSSSSSGGAINCGSSVYKLLIEQTTFISCSTSSGNGGGICFSNTASGECVLSKICGYDCSCNSFGQCIFIEIKNVVNFRNHVNDSSITHSLKKSSSPDRTLHIYYGNILCPSVNLTNNECYYTPALLCHPTTGTGSPASETCRISYSSIVNNTANGGYICINLNNRDSSHCIDMCNILNNKQTSTGYGPIYAYANVLIKDSCILGNNPGNTVFYENYASAKITISNCTIDNSKYSGSVIFTKTIENSFIHALSHISTQKCDSYFDSYGTLTAKPNVPSQNTKNQCYGYLMSYIYKHPMIDPFRSVEFIFLLSMLPSDS
jgi:hypothetical protein